METFRAILYILTYILATVGIWYVVSKLTDWYNRRNSIPRRHDLPGGKL